MDATTLGLVGAVLVLLGAATAMVQVLRRRTDSTIDPAILETFRQRIRAWWILCAVLGASMLMHPTVTVVLFALLAFWALREFITLTPTRPGDHRTLFWVFFVWWPLQFVLVGMARYELFSIVIPVYAFLFIPTAIAMSGDSKRFLERTAKIQAGLLICVYCLSYAPALLTLPIPKDQEPAPVQAAPSVGTPAGTTPSEPAARSSTAGTAADTPESDANKCARLLFFFVLMVQLSDALQFASAQVPSKHVIAPAINPTKTWEGLLGGAASVALIGAALSWATPFPYWFAAIMSAVVAVMGFAGALTMSAIKRDRGVKDYGTLVAGHAGVLDRIDSICFAAPVFYHFTRYYVG